MGFALLLVVIVELQWCLLKQTSKVPTILKGLEVTQDIIDLTIFEKNGQKVNRSVLN